MVIISKFTPNGLKFFILYSFMLLNVPHLHAEQSAQATLESNYNLGNKKESSDINTQDYLWNFELRPDLQKQVFKVKLLNPHPQWSMLNKRASEIAQQTDYSSVIRKTHQDAPIVSAQNSLYESPTNQTTLRQSPSKQRPVSTAETYTLSVQFIQGIRYKTQPQFTQVRRYLNQLCRFSPEDENFSSEIINNKVRDFNPILSLSIDTKGEVSDYEISPSISDEMFKQRLNQDLQKIRFLTYNENGTPIPFKASQTFHLSCDNDAY